MESVPGPNDHQDRSSVGERAGHDLSDRPDWFKVTVFAAPLAAYLIIGSLVPAIYERAYINANATESGAVVMTTALLKLAAMVSLIAWCGRWVVKSFPIRIGPASVVVGLIGGVVWIGLCRLQWEQAILEAAGVSADWQPRRDAINPWSLFPDAAERAGFLALRFSLLVAAVPIAEEWLLRGFLMRLVERTNWETMPLRQMGYAGCVTGTLYGVLAHPGEWIAAAVWFSLITVMMKRTGRIWDCVMAHAVTNAVLGIYVIVAEDWRLW